MKAGKRHHQHRKQPHYYGSDGKKEVAHHGKRVFGVIGVIQIPKLPVLGVRVKKADVLNPMGKQKTGNRLPCHPHGHRKRRDRKQQRLAVPRGNKQAKQALATENQQPERRKRHKAVQQQLCKIRKKLRHALTPFCQFRNALENGLDFCPPTCYTFAVTSSNGRAVCCRKVLP